jgi:hypothetical protein
MTMSKRKSNAQGGSAAKPEAGTGPEQEAPEGTENVVHAADETAGDTSGPTLSERGDGSDYGGDDAATGTAGSAESVNDEEGGESAETATPGETSEGGAEDPTALRASSARDDNDAETTGEPARGSDQHGRSLGDPSLQGDSIDDDQRVANGAPVLAPDGSPDSDGEESVNDEDPKQAEVEAGSSQGNTDPADAVQSEPASEVEVGAEQAAVSDDAGAPGAEAGANPVEDDWQEWSDFQEAEPPTNAGSQGPNPDSIATTAMLAAGAAYYRAMRLGEDVPDGIDLEWLMPARAEERIVDRAFVERSVIYLAEFCRKVKGASTGTLVMHMKLGRYRSSGETTAEEDVAFTVFAQTLQQLDRLAEIRATEAREKHKKIPKPAAIDIEETTLALVDEPMALTEIGMRSR